MKFLEVFHQLNLESDLKELFEEVTIEKVTASVKTGDSEIHTISPRILDIRHIRAMERQLQKQIFAHTNSLVRINDHYVLTRQYTPENLWEIYRESFLQELSEKGQRIRSVVYTADLSFNEEEVTLRLMDNFLNKDAESIIKKYLQSTYLERFGMNIIIKTEYIPMEMKQEVDTDLELDKDSYSSYEEYNDYEAVYQDGNGVSFGFEESDSEVSAESKDQNDTVHSGVNQESSKNMNTIGNRSTMETGAGKPGSTMTDVHTGTSSGKSAEEQKPATKSKSKAYEKGRFGKKKLPDDPDLLFGRPFEGDVQDMKEVQDEIGEVVLRGRILRWEERELRNEKFLVTFTVTDYTDTISAKIFAKAEQMDEVHEAIQTNKFIKFKGYAQFDTYEKEVTIGSIVGIKRIPDFTTKRKDTSVMKRVELHAHTTMSDMDSVVSPKTLVKTAFDWGHRAVAITDHGVVQAFTEANHALNKKDYADDPVAMEHYKEFKIIYGVEAYLVDDVKDIVVNSKEQSLQNDYVVFDIETTGLHVNKDKITEIGAVKISNGQIVDRFSTFVNPEMPIPFENTKLTGITDDMVIDSPTIESILPQFLAFCEGCILVAHNAQFDVGFIESDAAQLTLPFDMTSVDTVGLARLLMPGLAAYKLNFVAKQLGIPLEGHHRAVNDAECTAGIYLKFLEMMEEKEIKNLSEINSMGRLSDKVIKTMPMYHAVILCQNDIGRVNLYRLISYSHIDYYQKRPRIPKSVYMKYSEGLLIGSACEAGELYQAYLNNRSQNEIVRLAKFYDYYEIQPLGNNAFMLESDKYTVNTREDLIEINKKIVQLGETYNKPVVATCDVHFLNPEDEIYRRIIMAGKGFKDADDQAPLFLRTTEEMLEEFAYLGKEKAEEVVITNTNLIADRIEKISPVRPDKCPPVIEDSDKTLRQICYDKAHSMYGQELPTIVSERLEHELNSIITNGFAVMYIIAQKLVWKSNEDGYLVGSRGSVGSSFVATMAGITEVNPLPPHYYCDSCFYNDFTSEVVKENAANSGFDLPDAVCPVCGKPLKKDGNNIPFETFLGFNGDKEPDIDLNFSGEYQSKAHDYTEVIFGEGHTFRAGTIGTLAEKTAYGYAIKYFEERGIHKRRAEMERIAQGCEGVRRTSGQHPGGIIVLPHGEEIYSFTPVQRPANDMTTKTVTTHFDYHSIDHNLLKLDILGHDDPTMIRMLEDITGVHAQDIPMDDKKVLSLFESTEALGIRPEDIDGCDLGSLGIPELGTDFVIQMLKDTKPKTFSDMIRISGLSHGTDVWLNNTQTLIAEKKCTLATAICTRDDIMTYLISMGVESGLSFKIMESVRKGKSLTPEWEAEMSKHNVPDWYLWSCKQIKYMFPKAHACAYVMMAFRIAYFKVYYPLAYYAAYFGIRATAMNYKLMCRGKDILLREMQQLKSRDGSKDPAVKLSNKEEDVLKDMKNVLEMYARGFEFMPIDIYKAKAKEYQVIDGKIMPSLCSIDGLGEKAADQIVQGAAKGKFLSKNDFKTRCKVSTTVADTMGEMGLLGDIPESDQMSLFDMMGQM